MLDLTMTRDKTAVFFLTVKQADGTAQPLAGTVLWFHAAASAFQINKSSASNGIVITDAPGGLATLTISPADTAALANNEVTEMPCELTLASGAQAFELDRGTLTVLGNVGTP